MRAAPTCNHHVSLLGITTQSPAGIIAGVLVAAISTTFMLEAMRVFVSYTVFVVDQSNRIALAAIVLGVILSIGLAGLLIRILGPARSITLPLIVLALSRIALQFWPLPEGRLILGALAVIGWGWLTIALLSMAREAVTLGLGFGLGLDLTSHHAGKDGGLIAQLAELGPGQFFAFAAPAANHDPVRGGIG